MPSAISRVTAPLKAFRASIDRLFGTVFPETKYQLRRRAWKKRWRSKNYVPFFEPDGNIPEEVRKAVEERWFPVGGKLLDIGCGSGWIAAWLTDRGYCVVGVDYAPAAIERARATYPQIDSRLQWRVVDILHDPPPRTDFDAVLDRGCLHKMPRRFWPTYAEKVRGCAKPGARFLLLIAADHNCAFRSRKGHDTLAEVTRYAELVFAPYFCLERREDIHFELAGGYDEPRIPGVALRMTARG